VLLELWCAKGGNQFSRHRVTASETFPLADPCTNRALSVQCPLNQGDVASWLPYEPALLEGSTVTIEVCPGDPQDGGPGYTSVPEVGAMQEEDGSSPLEVSGFRVVVKPGGYQNDYWQHVGL